MNRFGLSRPRNYPISMRLLAIAGICVALCGCNQDQPDDRPSPAVSQSAAWTKGLGECYWELHNADGSTRLSAWVLTDRDGGSGTALAFADSAKFPDVPIGDDLAVRLIADGEASRSIATRGFHPEGQGAYMLSALFGPEQRSALAGADQISIEFDGKTVASVTAKAFPSLAELAACDDG